MSEMDLQRFQEKTLSERFALQNPQLLKVRMEGGSIHARLGSMVAYQGEMKFEYQSGGVGRWLKKAVTGEGAKLMSVSGTGDLFLAHDARQIIILDLNNERMTVTGENILALDEGIEWDIKRVEGAGIFAGGLFNVHLEGTGKVALSSYGEPVLLNTGTPTFADPASAIAWSGNVQTSLKKDMSLKTFTGRGSGETFQISFAGQGWVLVQSSEGPTVPPHSHGSS